MTILMSMTLAGPLAPWPRDAACKILPISCSFPTHPLSIMAARPPPARPHIGLNPSFQNQHSGEWGEDDAWDSGSDSESPRQSTIASSWLPTSRAPSVSATSPKPVPKSPSRPSASSSTLGFSYTHVNAPSPSSYPPRVEQSQEPPQKGGWTIVRKSTDGHKSVEEKEDSKVEGAADDPLVEDMVVGSFEPEVVVEPPAKPKVERGSIREDVDDIVTGEYFAMAIVNPVSSACRSPARHPSPVIEARRDAGGRLPRSSCRKGHFRQTYTRTVNTDKS